MSLTKEDLQAIAELIDMKLEPIRADVAKIDKIIPKINGLYESIVGTGEKFTRLEVVEGRVDRLEDDVFAIKEQIAK